VFPFFEPSFTSSNGERKRGKGKGKKLFFARGGEAYAAGWSVFFLIFFFSLPREVGEKREVRG